MRGRARHAMLCYRAVTIRDERGRDEGMKRIIACAALVLALALSACGSGGSSRSASQASKSPASQGSTSPAATNTQTGGITTKSYSTAPPMTIDVNKKYFATIKMDIGDINLEL